MNQSSINTNSWSVFPKAFWLFTEQFRWKFIGVSLITFLIHFYELVPPFLLALMLDFFTKYKTGDSLMPFYLLCISFGVTWCIAAIVRLLGKGSMGQMAILIKSNVRILGFERLMQYSLQWHLQDHAGGKVDRIMRGSDVLKSFISRSFNQVFPIITSFIGVLVVFLFLNVWYWLFLVFYTVLFFFIEFAFNKKHEILSKEANILREKTTGVFTEHAGNILTIKAQNTTSGSSRLLADQEQKLQKIELALERNGYVKWIFFQVWNGITVSVFLFLAGKDILAGTMSVGLIAVYYSYFNQLRKAASDTTDLLTELLVQKSILGRLMELFADELEWRGTLPFPKNWKKIELQHIQFHYEQNKKGLFDLSHVFHRGEKIGIVGTSGGGKSTFIKLFLGLITPQSGDVFFDKVPLQSLSHNALLDKVGVILQDTEIFHLSVRENILLSRTISEETLEKVLSVACLVDVIERLPEGIDTVIGEKGYMLSGGERQRIGIARALCKSAEVLLMDEATSALDEETEKSVLTGIFEEFPHLTVFMVAHRLSTLTYVDRVIEFQHGKLYDKREPITV